MNVGKCISKHVDKLIRGKNTKDSLRIKSSELKYVRLLKQNESHAESCNNQLNENKTREEEKNVLYLISE